MRNRQFIANLIGATSLSYMAKAPYPFPNHYCGAIRRAVKTVTVRTMTR